MNYFALAHQQLLNCLCHHEHEQQILVEIEMMHIEALEMSTLYLLHELLWFQDL